MQVDQQWLQASFPDLQNITVLKAGGQKLVFSATDKSYGSVVLKLIHPSQSAESVSREQLAVDQVQSKRVPRILRSGQVRSQFGNCFWFLEERIVGLPVRDLLVHGPLDLENVLRLGLHTLDALVKAEEVRIVHRDVKPDNIMCDAAGSFWLLDFGIARHLQLQSLTATALRFGKFTPGYGPPEQFRNYKTDIDGRADLFGLGVTLFECAIGYNPFRKGAANDLEIIRRTETVPLPPVVLQITNAKEFSNFVSALTQKRRDHRPPSARFAFNWLKEICDKEGIS